MANINLGRIGIAIKGEWNSTFKYERLDLVSFEGGGYVAIAPNKNIPPTDSSYWLQIAAPGKTGSIDNLDESHIIDALGYTPLNKALFDIHKADYVTDSDGVHGLKIESGTFTPVIAGSTTEGNNGYNYQLGVYKAIGSRVFLDIALHMHTKDPNMAGNISIKGLPFVAKYIANMRYGACVGACDGITNGISVVIPAAGSELHLYKYATSTRVTAADISELLWLVIHVNYEKA